MVQLILLFVLVREFWCEGFGYTCLFTSVLSEQKQTVSWL